MSKIKSEFSCRKFISALALAVSFCVLAVSSVASVPSGDGVAQGPQYDYINQWYRVAVTEMYRSGVPASITLAQGLLESGFGKSELAVKANNHFGIKCHDWTGQKAYFDDDRKGECFRKYDHAEDSFKDHSDFLRYRDRYKSLFDLPLTDYRGWAYGLKAAGYATDPAYPSKLINLIETYSLSDYDTYTLEQVSGTAPAQSGREIRQQERKLAREARRTARDARKAGMATEAGVPESPTYIESPVPVTGKDYEKFSFSMSRQMYSQNNVPFIYSVEGETYASIAHAYNLFTREILRFNDLDPSFNAEAPLKSGTVVYLQAKKSKAARLVDKYVAEGGETLWEISQRYAVKLKSLEKMNGFTVSYIIRPEDTIILR